MTHDAVPVHRGHGNYLLYEENVHWVAVVVWALGWGPFKNDLLVFVGWVCVSASACLCACGSQEKASHRWELELKADLNALSLVLGLHIGRSLPGNSRLRKRGSHMGRLFTFPALSSSMSLHPP